MPIMTSLTRRFVCVNFLVVLGLAIIIVILLCLTANRSHLAELIKGSSVADKSSIELLLEDHVSPDDPRITRYIRSHLTLPSTLPLNLKEANKGRTDLAQIGQSRFIDDLLKGRRNGFFLECGACDGELVSNTLFFEIERNWTGILIEANPQYYHDLPGKHRKAYGLQACLSISGRASMLKIRVAGSSGGLVSKLHPFQLGLSEVEQGYDVDVWCFPLNSVMDAIGVNHIDYMSLDVEGAELDVLKTVDWKTLRIDTLTLEFHIGGHQTYANGTEEKRLKLEELRTFMRSTGLYKEVGILPRGAVNEHGQDVVFARNDLGLYTPR